jgi:hypothetical protein
VDADVIALCPEQLFKLRRPSGGTDDPVAIGVAVADRDDVDRCGLRRRGGKRDNEKDTDDEPTRPAKELSGNSRRG